MKMEPTIDRISLDVLDTDDLYQPALSSARVKSIVNDFRPDLFQVITVNQRSGSDRWYVVDGQHRVQAAKTLRYPSVKAFLFYGLTVKQEAEMFLALNTNRRKDIDSVSKYHAKITAEDPETLEIEKVLSPYGLAVRKAKNGNLRHISSPSSLYFALRNDGPGTLSDALGILMRAYPNDYKRWGQPLIICVAGLLLHYPDLDKTRLVQQLQNIVPRALIAQIKDRARTLGSERWSLRESRPNESRELAPGIHILRNLYNKNLRTNKI